MNVLRLVGLLAVFLPLQTIAISDDLLLANSNAFSAEDQAQFQRAVAALVNQNASQARALLSPLADKGHAEAQSALGMLLLQTREPGTAQKGLRWIYRAARNGVWRAQARLATAHMNGEYLPEDLIKARFWMLQALAGGGSRVLHDLAVLNRRTLDAARQAGLDKDVERQHDLLLAAAETGLPEAQFRLAQLYARGGIQAPEDKGRTYWLKLAAEQSHNAAQESLALSMLEQETLSSDARKKVVELLKSAADPGSRQAQYKLGQLFSTRWVPDSDSGEANYWYRLAGEQGHEAAQYQLGVNYTVGKGEKADPAESFRWFKMAASQGNERAKYNLGVLSLHGRGVPQDKEQARKWLREAANAGVARAADLLANKQAMAAVAPLTVSKVPAVPQAQVTAISGDAWFNSLPAGGYTIQLITARKRESVDRLISSLGVGQEQVFIYRLNRNKPLHVAQYGFYASKKLAQQAASRLAGRLKGFKPVVRPISSVQRNVRRKARG